MSAEIFARTKKALLTMGCFFAACPNGKASHSFCNVQFDHYRGDMFVPLATGVLEDVEVLEFHDMIRFCGSDPVLCLLAVWRSQEIDWSRYGSTHPLFFGYDF